MTTGSDTSRLPAYRVRTAAVDAAVATMRGVGAHLYRLSEALAVTGNAALADDLADQGYRLRQEADALRRGDAAAVAAEYDATLRDVAGVLQACVARDARDAAERTL